MILSDHVSSPVTFHSRYAPFKEAQRHVESMLSGKKPALVFIIGGGLNYISEVFAEQHPKIICVSLQPSDDFIGHEVIVPQSSWYPSSNRSLRETIMNAIAGNRLAGGVMVLEWPPVVNHFQDTSDLIRGTLRDVLEGASSDAATTGYWATRWLGNSIRFVKSIKRTARLTAGSSLIVLACAGPSLAELMPRLRASRSDMALWALASAVPALLRNGLLPDLVIATDPGYWNGAHLRDALFQKIPIAMPPSSYASCGILQQATIIPVDTGLSFERAAIKATNSVYETARAAGSAAGTALSLALRWTDGPIALAGYDLAAKGLVDHVQPYAFDILDEKKAGRLASAYSARASRVLDTYPFNYGEWRGSRAFSACADTIRVPEYEATRVFRLGTSAVETPFRRADFSDIPVVSRAMPECIGTPARTDMSNTACDEAVWAMLEHLSREAFEQASSAINNSEPIPYDSALYYKALAPRESASLIADAARGEASLKAVLRATTAAKESAAKRMDRII